MLSMTLKEFNKSTERLLTLVPHDKALHALVGLMLYSFIALLYSPTLALGVVIIVGLGKELFDEWNYGGFDWIDLWFTITLPLVLYGLETLIKG